MRRAPDPPKLLALMPAYWLTYVPKEESPDRGWPLSDLRALIERVEVDPDAPGSTEWWRIANGDAQIGERVYVFKQGTRSPRGVIGVGEIVGRPERLSTPTDPEMHLRARIRFQKLIDPTAGFLLPLAQVDDFVPQSLIAAQRSGTRVLDNVAAELERRLAPMLLAGTPAFDGRKADNPAYDPASAANERERAMRAICIRRGQPAFRAALLAAYGGRCAVTGCDVQDVLEAAHISPYSGPSSDHVCNGLLLRADIHTLFDCGLLAFHPETRQVVLADSLRGSDYADLAGQALREPWRPHASAQSTLRGSTVGNNDGVGVLLVHFDDEIPMNNVSVICRMPGHGLVPDVRSRA